MACLVHECPKCGYHDMDNETLKVCPQCASNEITNHYDEHPDSFAEEEKETESELELDEKH